MSATQAPEPPAPLRRLSPSAQLAWAFVGALTLAGAIALAESSVAAAWPAALRALVAGPRLLLGAAFVLYLPGHALTAALFPPGGEGAARLDDLERVGLSLGLSVAWIPVLALLLDRLPWGMRLGPILAGEALTVFAGLAVAAWRVRDPSPAPAPLPRPASPSPGLRRLLGGAGFLLLASALAAIWLIAAPAPDARLTEFYALGPAGAIEEYPRETTVGAPLSLTLGLVNRETGAQTYRVEVWTYDPWSGRWERVQATGPIPLAPAEQVEWSIAWAMPRPGPDQQVEFRLFRDPAPGSAPGAGSPYRRLSLWLDVAEAAP